MTFLKSAYMICWRKAEMSLAVQSVNVILIQQQPCGGNVRNRRSMAISKGCGKRGKRLFVFLAFHQTDISTAFARRRFFSTIVNESYQRDVTRHEASIEVETSGLPVIHGNATSA